MYFYFNRSRPISDGQAVGKTFGPQLHEAASQRSVDNATSGQVLEELRQQINGALVRKNSFNASKKQRHDDGIYFEAGRFC